VSEQRSEIRKVVFCSIQLEYEDTAGKHKLAGVLEDRSPSGAGIRLRKPIEPGMAVQVSGPRQDFAGVVQHCRREGYTYFAGLRIRPAETALSKQASSEQPIPGSGAGQ
jgi:PilZ domain